jgi:hypothetical protein
MPQAQDIGPQAADLDETAPALDVESILAIHRDRQGYIGFVRKPDPAAPLRLDRNGKPYSWENLFSIRADDLRSMLPALAHWLTHDSYMTVHAYHRAAPYPNRQTGLPDVWRKEKHLRSLTACYADLDCGRPESEEPGAALTWRQAQHDAEYLADTGVIPMPSIMARSGRGVYLFWLLRDATDPEKLPHAWPEKVELYKACNRALNERLRAHRLPADKAAIDAARVLRVPGSIHRKALTRVRYVIQLDDDARGFVYTLPELAEALDLPALDGDLPDQTRKLARPAQYRKVKQPGAAPLRSHGALALNALRAQDVLTLSQARGGFLKRGMKYPDGSTSPGRRFTLTLYANFLRGSGADQAAALDALRSMAANMLPPWPDSPGDPTPQDLVAAEYATVRRRRWKNEKLCALLGVSADLARELDLKTIRPRDVAAEADQARPLQADVIQARRDFVRQYIEAHGSLTARRLARVLHAAGFISSPENQETANQDLNALGYVVTRSRGGRPRRQPAQATGGAVQLPEWLKGRKVGK